jgi:PhnB protein
MSLSLHLQFPGTCRDAFTYYERELGGRITFMATYAESPLGDQVPEAWRSMIMHATMSLHGEMTLMGSDIQPGEFTPPQGFGIVLGVETPEEARRAFEALAAGGTVTMPLEATFWAAAFGVVRDRWGLTWQINCEQPPAGEA